MRLLGPAGACRCVSCPRGPHPNFKSRATSSSWLRQVGPPQVGPPVLTPRAPGLHRYYVRGRQHLEFSLGATELGVCRRTCQVTERNGRESQASGQRTQGRAEEEEKAVWKPTRDPEKRVISSPGTRRCEGRVLLETNESWRPGRQPPATLGSFHLLRPYNTHSPPSALPKPRLECPAATCGCPLP